MSLWGDHGLCTCESYNLTLLFPLNLMKYYNKSIYLLMLFISTNQLIIPEGRFIPILNKFMNTYTIQ